jgi:hypothetical protein
MASEKIVPSPGNGQSVPPPPVSELLADRLGRLKTLINDLQAEYDELRKHALLSGQAEHFGRDWMVVVVQRRFRKITVTRAENLLPPELFARVVQIQTQTLVTVKPIMAPEPLKPAKPPKPVKPPRKPHLARMRPTAKIPPVLP